MTVDDTLVWTGRRCGQVVEDERRKGGASSRLGFSAPGQKVGFERLLNLNFVSGNCYSRRITQ